MLGIPRRFGHFVFGVIQSGLTCAIAAAIALWSAYLAGFHAGVEWKFWAGPGTCTGGGGLTGLPDLTKPALSDRMWENYTPRITYQATARNKFSFVWDEQPVCRTCSAGRMTTSACCSR
jgi:disulfide bond formation protein DsbB